MLPRRSLLLLPLLSLLLPLRAAADLPLAYMGLRPAPQTCSPWFLAEANRMMAQKLSELPALSVIAPSALSRALGSPQVLDSCNDDGCMTVLAQTAGAAQVLWGTVERSSATGLVVRLRALEVPSGRLLGSASPGCDPCEEGLLLASLAGFDARSLALGAQVPAATVDTASVGGLGRVMQIPGVHRPLHPDEQQRAGWLTVHSQPPGAKLSLFTYSVGLTPVTRLSLLPGAYPATLEAPGFEPLRGTLQVASGRETQQMLQLRPLGTLLRVVSLPIGAEVLVDGRPVGQTPLSAQALPFGEHELTVQKAGYLPERRRVLGQPGVPVELTVGLRPAPPTEGRLDLKSRPSKASVMIDGQPVGQTPLKKHELSAGEHLITLYLPGYAEREEVVQVAGGKTLQLNLTLSKQQDDLGTLSVRSNPAGAKAQLGGLSIGKTPVRDVQFKPGRHVLRLTLPGYPPYETEVEIRRGEHIQREVDLSAAAPDLLTPTP